jgi:hypothetical protein
LITENNTLVLNEKIQNVRNQLENWFYENRLIVNTEKSKVILFWQSRSIPSFRPLFCINNKEVGRLMDVKFLGIFITEDLSWTTHTQYVCQKLSKIIYLIKSLRDTVSRAVLINVYYAKFESVLKYGIIFWGGVHKDFKTLFKLQKKCVRVIKGEKKRVSCKNLFRELRNLTGTSLPSTPTSMVIIPSINKIYVGDK